MCFDRLEILRLLFHLPGVHKMFFLVSNVLRMGLERYQLMGASGKVVHHAIINQQPDNFMIASNSLNLTTTYV